MSNANWWAKQLGGQPAARPVQPQTPNQPQAYPPTTQQPAYQPPEVQQHTLPASATNALRCPGCGSGNYGSDGQTKPRCYDCGYPIQQSGSGVGKGITGGPQASGPATPAVQVQAGGWNPTTIIGHI